MKLNKKGFTIVELVIVIAVIAILAAVLIPTFSSVTAKAKQSAALQQAKSGMDSILALTEGAIADGSVFAVTDKSDNSVSYKFLYQSNSLKEPQKGLEQPIEQYDTTNHVYALYVSAQCWMKTVGGSNEDSDEAAAAKATTEGLILSVLQKEAAYSNATSVKLSATKVTNEDYFTLTVYEKAANDTTEGPGTDITAGETGTTFRVYYNADIQPTLVAFIGNND